MSSSAETTPQVVVVGGGVAGLATAYLLREAGKSRRADVRITVLEAEKEPGGSTRTEQKEGYTCEWGPNGFLDNEPLTLAFVEQLGLTHHLVKADARASRRYIYHTGALREVPLKPPAFLMSNLLPPQAKLRMAMEFFVPAKRNGAEETVYQFGRRRLGESFAKYLLDPMVSGIFAGDSHELSLEAVFPKMVEMEREYGGLFRAMIAKQKEARRNGTTSGGPGGANAVLHTFAGGMGELTTVLAEKRDGSIRTNSPVKIIERREGKWIVRTSDDTLIGDAVILACPSYAAADIIQTLSPKTADALRGITYAPADVVCHGISSHEIGHSLEGFGVLIPRSEHIRSLGSLWSDSIFPGQAPHGHHLLRTILGGAHDKAISGLSNDDLEDVAYRDNQRILHITGAPRFRRVFRHPRGIAQYTIGHLERVKQTEILEQEMPSLYFTGASYRGVSVNGCVKDAHRVAEAFWLNRNH